MKMSVKLALAAVASCVASLGLSGCPNPNDIGVQTFGVVQVTCVQASNNKPVANALVQVDGVTPSAQTNSAGQLTVSGVAIGSDIPASCNAAGLSGSTTIPSLTAASTASNPLPITIQMTPG